MWSSDDFDDTSEPAQVDLYEKTLDEILGKLSWLNLSKKTLDAIEKILEPEREKRIEKIEREEDLFDNVDTEPVHEGPNKVDQFMVLESILHELVQAHEKPEKGFMNQDFMNMIENTIPKITHLLVSNPLELNDTQLIELYKKLEPLNPNLAIEMITRRLVDTAAFTAMDQAITDDNNDKLNQDLLTHFQTSHTKMTQSARDLFNHLGTKGDRNSSDDTLINQQIGALNRQLNILETNFEDISKPNYKDYRNHFMIAYKDLMKPRKENEGKTDLQIIKSSRSNKYWRAFVIILQNLFSASNFSVHKDPISMSKEKSLKERGHHKFWKPRGYDHVHKVKEMRKEMGLPTNKKKK